MTQLVTKNRTIIVGEVLEELVKLPSESVHTVVTSPPYWGLRDYQTGKWTGGDENCDHSRTREPKLGRSTLGGSKETQGHSKEPYASATCPRCGAVRVDQQLGLEKTPQEYVDRVVSIFREIRRILRPEGTVWLNLGDSFASGKGTCFNPGGGSNSIESQGDRKDAGVHPLDRGNVSDLKKIDLKQKDLVGIPWMTAFALRKDGWWLRSEIIWAKTNGMPESVTDRPTKSHEHIFLLAKSEEYFYDGTAIKEPATESTIERMNQASFHEQTGGPKDYRTTGVNPNRSMRKVAENLKSKMDQEGESFGRQKRDVWNMSTVPSQVAHYAVFPPKLALTCVLAGTSEHGCCSKCATPWERRFERTDVLMLSAKGNYFNEGKTSVHGGERAQEGERFLKKFIGWFPSCQCGTKEVAPCVVLDPFHGSGTTGAVSEYLGRRYIGIELNPENAKMYDARLGEVKRSLLGGESPDKAPKSDDQISLF